jgi:hypothetical protein
MPWVQGRTRGYAGYVTAQAPKVCRAPVYSAYIEIYMLQINLYYCSFVASL